jgi:DNA segregation ATPase FtsK/SpoIIIE-like protein
LPYESTLLADLEDDEILEVDEVVHHQPSTTHEGSASSKTVRPQANIAKEDNPLSRLPSLDLLERPDVNRKAGFTPEQLERLSRLLEIKLREFNIDAKVVGALPGPVVTRFEVDPAPGVKVAKYPVLLKT